jgi:hypothetical protein
MKKRVIINFFQISFHYIKIFLKFIFLLLSIYRLDIHYNKIFWRIIKYHILKIINKNYNQSLSSILIVKFVWITNLIF